tara:strand:+ start:871 stop:1179 length:309 start_codon:yes stop_codon:yes gene_type:complete
MPHSIKFLTSDQASELRLKRVGRITKKAELVVHVEIHPRMDVDERFYEFDAVDVKHAIAIIHQWIMVHGATSAAYRYINDDGSLSIPSIYDKMDFTYEEFDQ